MPAFFLNTVFKVLAVLGALVLAWRVLSLAPLQRRLGDAILVASAEQRKRVMDNARQIAYFLKLALFLTPLFVIVGPLAMYFFMPEINAWLFFVAMLELTVLNYLQYRSEIWLIRYVGEHETKAAQKVD